MLRLLSAVAIGLVFGVLISGWLTPASDRALVDEAVASQPALGVGVPRVEDASNHAQLSIRIAALEDEVSALEKELDAERSRTTTALLTDVVHTSASAYALRYWNGPPGEVTLHDDAFAPGPSTLAGIAAEPGRLLVFEVTGSIVGAVRGTDVYTDDSSLAASAVHAGVLRADETGTIIVTVLPGQQRYAGSLRFGVFSSDSAGWTRSYSLERLD